jgi:hypothetical protein
MEVSFTPDFIGDVFLPACPVMGLTSSRCCTHGLSLATAAGGGSAPALSASAWRLIQSACVEVVGSRGSVLSHFSRACRTSPLASRALASADRRSSSSECTSAWQWSQTSAPGGSSCEQRLQLRINSGVVVDTGRKNASASMVVQEDAGGESANGPYISNCLPAVILHAILIPQKRINRPMAPHRRLPES